MYSFPYLEPSVVPCPVLAVASWPAYRFLKRQVRWSGIPIFWRIFHSLLWSTQSGFGIVNKAEIDVFLELSCFFNDPTDVGNLISGSSAFPKSSLNIWEFMVHILLKPGLENFEHYFTSMWDECNCVVFWAFFGIAFDQPRQHIKKQRDYFANKDPYRQNYGFSSSHVWMWELDSKESWAPKNWCF